MGILQIGGNMQTFHALKIGRASKEVVLKQYENALKRIERALIQRQQLEAQYPHYFTKG